MYKLLILLVCCCACATLHKASPENLQTRVRQFMDARMAGDWGQVYTMSDSAFQARTKRESFLSLPRQLQMKGYEVVRTEMTGPENGTAEIRYDFMVMGFLFKGKQETQDWIFEKGEWRKVVEDVQPIGMPVSK